MEKLCLLIQQAKAFLQNWYGIILEKKLKFKENFLKQEDKATFTLKICGKLIYCL